ncbi:MAG: hypothetical protein AB1696_19250 [Planctomycetota bacterium]
MVLLLPLLLVAWICAVVAFARWRFLRLAEGAQKCPNVLDDWAMQLFFKGTGLFLLGLILVVLVFCR